MPAAMEGRGAGLVVAWEGVRVTQRGAPSALANARGWRSPAGRVKGAPKPTVRCVTTPTRLNALNLGDLGGTA